MKKEKLDKSVALEIIKERYKEDTVMLIATSNNNVPSMRCVDTFFLNDSFWIVSDLRTNYVKEIMMNKYVMISDGGHNRFWCEAKMIGHPLDDSNLEIREEFKKVFHHWYEEVNNEVLSTVCFVKVKPYKAYIHKDKVGYQIEFVSNSVVEKAITHHIDVKLQPFW